MDLDQLAPLWRNQSEMEWPPDRSLLSNLQLARARAQLSSIARRLGWEIAAWAGFVLLMGSLLGTQRTFNALLCHAYAVLMLAWCVREYVAARALHMDEAVSVLQERFSAWELLHISRLQWALLGGIVLWAPCTLILWQAFTGFAATGGPWLTANLGFGLLLAGLSVLLARRYPRANRYWLLLSGSRLEEARHAMERIQHFRR